MLPDSIQFPPDVRRMLFVLIGHMPLTGSSDMAYTHSGTFDRAADSLDRVRGRLRSMMNQVDGALPPHVAQQFKDAVNTLSDPSGSDRLGDFSTQLRSGLAQNQVAQSRNIMEAKWQIIAEIIMLIAQLALLAALSFFTGGTSMTQAIIAKTRSTLTVLLVMQRLSANGLLFPTLTSALQEAVITFATRIAMMKLNKGNRAPGSIDWAAVGKAGLFGLMGGLFTAGIYRALPNPFRAGPDSSGWINFTGEVPKAFISEGVGDAGSETLINGLFDGNWTVNPMSLVGGGLSGISGLAMETGLFILGSKGYDHFFKPRPDGLDVNSSVNDPSRLGVNGPPVPPPVLEKPGAVPPPPLDVKPLVPPPVLPSVGGPLADSPPPYVATSPTPGPVDPALAEKKSPVPTPPPVVTPVPTPPPVVTPVPPYLDVPPPYRALPSVPPASEAPWVNTPVADTTPVPDAPTNPAPGPEPIPGTVPPPANQAPPLTVPSLVPPVVPGVPAPGGAPLPGP
ncbi:WXG100-like domain-containing protein, partial [Streptomyces bohaiensis]|nr:hypothetical protein [Streptomyces bohaiensis]